MDLGIGTHEETMERIGMQEFVTWQAWYELEARDYKEAQKES